MGNELFEFWNPKPNPVAQDGLQTIRDVMIAVEVGRPLGEASGRHLVQAFQMYMDGHDDISKNLGLRPRQGRCNEAPLRRERLLHRDRLIVAALEGLGGATRENRQHLCEFLAGCNRVLPLVEPFLSPIQQLRAMHGGQLKLSEKQI